MIDFNWLILAGGGLLSGVLAGLLGIGGGIVIVPLLVALGYTPLQSVATSSFVIVISSLSGSIQNWRMGYFDWQRVIYLGIPALFNAQAGVYLATKLPAYLLLFLLGLLLLTNIYFIQLKKSLAVRQSIPDVPTADGQMFEEYIERMLGDSSVSGDLHRNNAHVNRMPRDIDRGNTVAQLIQNGRSIWLRAMVGGVSGLLAGLLGMGGGTILVTFQMLLLGEPIKVAIQTSLGVIVGTAASACIGHAAAGNVLVLEGVILGAGGLLGAQLSTRVLPKLSDRTIDLLFRSFLGLLASYIFWQARTQTDLPTFGLLVAFTVMAIAGLVLIRAGIARLSAPNRTRPQTYLRQQRTARILAVLVVGQSMALAWLHRDRVWLDLLRNDAGLSACDARTVFDRGHSQLFSV